MYVCSVISLPITYNNIHSKFLQVKYAYKNYIMIKVVKLFANFDNHLLTILISHKVVLIHVLCSESELNQKYYI